MPQVKAKAAGSSVDAVPSKREARAGDVLAKLKKRARLDERLLAEPVVKEKDENKALQSRGVDWGDEAAGEGEEVPVVMSSTLQAAKVSGNLEKDGIALFMLREMFFEHVHLVCFIGASLQQKRFPSRFPPSGAVVQTIKPASPPHPTPCFFFCSCCHRRP
jgi:hypothetical protein